VSHDPAPDVLEAFRSAAELVAAESVCRSEDASRLPLRYRGEVLEQGRHIILGYVDLRRPGTASVGVWLTACGPRGEILYADGRTEITRHCLGHGRGLELRKLGDTWVVVNEEEGGYE
jgi:hypothetical protein